MSIKPPSTTPVVRRPSDRAEAERERPANFGGPRLKLSVIGEIPGFHLYWANDEDGEIEQLLYEGFEKVHPSEVRMQSHIVADADVGASVSRFVGHRADGGPLRAYLLKCPEDVWADREASRYSQADAWDSAIRAGQVQQDSGRYRPKGHTINLSTNTEIR